MKFHLPVKKVITLCLALGVYSLYYLTVMTLLEKHALHTSSPVTIAQHPNFITHIQPNGKTEISSKELALKVDTQRKVMMPKSASEAALIKQIITQQGGTVVQNGTTVVAELPKNTENQIEQTLAAQTSVKHVEVDYPIAVTGESEPWGVSRVEAPAVWSTTSGTGIKVAILDTGIDYTHPDLAGRYSGGYDFINNDSDPMDDHGHGTHVSGIVAADIDGFGVEGVAPQAQLMAVKVLGSDGTGYISTILNGIDYAMQHGAQVINMSFGTSYNSSLLADKMQQAANKGILLVAAAGNDSGPLLYPAAYPSVISVAATDSNDHLASFSNYGAEVAAPGVSITSTVPGGYATWSGTSMAAPHVTATIALMLANHVANIRDTLHTSAIDLGSTGFDNYFGYGLIDAKHAVLGSETPTPNASMSATPTLTYPSRGEYQGSSSAVRQDTNQVQALEHRQNEEHIPTPQNTQPIQETPPASSITSSDTRNPQTSPGQSGEMHGKKDVKGAATSAPLWRRFFIFLSQLFSR